MTTGPVAAATEYLASIPSPPRGVIHLWILPIRAYAFCIIIGIIVAVIWGNRRFVARGGRPGRVTDITVFCVPFGLVGGRLYHVITDNELYFRAGRNPWNAFAIWDGGLGIWGAIALGGVGAWLGCRYYKVPLSAFADAVAPGIIVAQAIGRLGNYFNQELFGSKTTLPWGLDVFLRTPGGESGTILGCDPLNTGAAPEFNPTYIKADPTVLCGTYQPTFLYELLWNLAIAAVLVWADRKFRLGRGQVFWLYVAGYTLGRGWIETLRIDTANTFLGLRINVFTSILLFIVSVAILIARRGVEREDPASLQGKPPKLAAGEVETGPATETAGEQLDGAGVELAETADSDLDPDQDPKQTQHLDEASVTAGAPSEPVSSGSDGASERTTAEQVTPSTSSGVDGSERRPEA
ncbi:prolipoprotein diacylglyceryl transferase [Nakamurella sp. UYEF19]|uniref:prolipoprotein diacylglyceryl transferase n=1 Tax=Nakamurella sp. UYEF19 TaxID=1756392 RepID=UPI003396DA5D